MKKVDYPTAADWRNYYIAVVIIVIVVIIVTVLTLTPSFNYRLQPTVGAIIERYKSRKVEQKVKEENRRMGEAYKERSQKREAERKAQIAEARENTTKYMKQQFQKQAQQVERMRQEIDKQKALPKQQ